MEFDQNKKIDVQVSESDFVENQVARKKTFSLKDRGIDPLDLAIVPVAVGVFVSLGFLFAGIFGQISPIAETVSSIIGAIG